MCNKILPNHYYRHFKGGFYYVYGIATHSESGEKFVIYSDKHRVWVRPIDMFMSEVDKEKYPNANQKYRFELVMDKDWEELDLAGIPREEYIQFHI